MEVSDEETQLDLTAGIADIRNQLYVAQRQCREIISTGAQKSTSEEKGLDEDEVDRMEVEEEITPLKSEQVEHSSIVEEEMVPENVDQSHFEVKYLERM